MVKLECRPRCGANVAKPMASMPCFTCVAPTTP